MNRLLKGVITGNTTDVRSALAAGADVEARDPSGRTSLIHAAINGDEEILSMLVDAGAQLDAQDSTGNTALHFAAQNFCLRILHILLRRGASVHLRDEHGNSALHRAVFSSQGRGEIILALLESGAEPDTPNLYGMSPREVAGSIANYEISQFFP